MRRMFYVTNADGKIFAGISAITMLPVWFTGDARIIEDVGIVKFKRDSRWLAQALKYDSTAHWAEIERS